MSQQSDLLLEIARLREQLHAERVVSAALRKEIIETNHRAAIERGRCKSCEYNPQKPKDDHG